jgi:pantoate--beta-alanine ligase
MGALHEGHLALIRHARTLSDVVIVTVFVNPTQFGPNEDFDAYPRDLAKDVALAEGAGASFVFAPKIEEMYPDPDRTRVRVVGLTDGMCGASRPGHFDGVTTVVAKLFALVGPSTAVFGKKDYQQFRVIAQMARDLFLPVHVVGHPTVREADGLALSSRNTYLSAEDRSRALSIPRALRGAAHSFETGERDPKVLLEMVRGALDRAGLRVDYVELRDADTLLSLDEGAAATTARAVLAVAAFAGKTRLIDNIVLGEDAAPASLTHS